MRRSYLRYIAALLLFGTNGLLVSAIHLPSCEIVIFRTLLGSGVLFCLVAALRPAMLTRRDALLVIGSGAAMGASWIAQYEAFRLVGVGISSLVYCLGPVCVMTLAPRLLGERPGLAHWIGLTAVVLGVALVNGEALGAGASSAGVVCALIAAAAYAGMVLLIKRVKDTCGMRAPALQVLAACAFSLAASLVFQIADVEQLTVPGVSDVAALLMLGLVNGGVCCYWYFDSISKLPAQSVVVCDYLEPLSALCLSAAVLGESLGAWQVVGAALVFLGAVGAELVSRLPKQRG